MLLDDRIARNIGLAVWAVLYISVCAVIDQEKTEHKPSEPPLVVLSEAKVVSEDSFRSN